jgi:transposase-like protein
MRMSNRKGKKRFGPMFAGEARRSQVSRMRGFRHWRLRLDERYVKVNGEMVYLWRAVDRQGEILESYVTKTRDKGAALALHEEGAEAPRLARADHHRRTAFLRRRHG